MGRPKHYVVRLNDEERNDLNTLLRKGHAKARSLTRARILLLSDEGKTDPAIADALKINPRPCATSASASPKKDCTPPSPNARAQAPNASWTPSRKRS